MGFTPEPVVKRGQIAAAKAIHDHHMDGWRESDEALDRLAEFLPQWDVDSVLAKAAVVNQLYNARHDQVLRASRRIAEVMADRPADPVRIVELVAPLARGDGEWTYLSFASKFGHFFVDHDAIPVYDNWAVQALRHHFGRLRWGSEPDYYRAFVGYVYALRDTCVPTCSLRELDRYLWLSGMYRKGRGKDVQAMKNLGLGQDVRDLFTSQDPEIKHELARLLGEASPT